MSDYVYNLGDGYIVVSESNADQFITHEENLWRKITIPCTVKDWTYDDSFIIAIQYSNPSCEELLNIEEKEKFYWIIAKSGHKVYGPLDSITYTKKRKELGLPKTLKFF